MTADPSFFQGPGRRRGSFHQGVAVLLLLVIVPATVATVQGFDERPTASPPVVLTAGEDLATAQARGLVTQGAGDGAEGGIDLQLHVPAGTQVTIDRLFKVHTTDEVDSYEMALRLAGEATDASDVSASAVTVRLWTGEVAPQADDASQVCQVLRVGGSPAPAPGTCDAADVHVQLIVEVPEGQEGPGLFRLVTTAWIER